VKALWAVLVVATTACWQPLPPITASRGPTLLVTNRGLGHLVVYDELGRLVTVMPNQTRCVYLRHPEEEQTLEYEIEGQTCQTLVFDPGMAGGAWRLEVGTLPKYDVTTLRPRSRRCDPAAKHGTD
jgi:hypothetical protein